MYVEFKQAAMEDSARGYRYGMEALFRFYSYGLEENFSEAVYLEFEDMTLQVIFNLFVGEVQLSGGRIFAL